MLLPHLGPLRFTAYVIAFLSGDRILRVGIFSEPAVSQIAPSFGRDHQIVLATSDPRSSFEKARDQARRRFARRFPTVFQRFPCELSPPQRHIVAPWGDGARLPSVAVSSARR